jgi:hypothetical protein
MRLPGVVGILLLVFGLLSLAFGSLSYTTRETVIDLGPVEATAERHQRIPLPPLLGIVSVAGGVALIWVSSRRK